MPIGWQPPRRAGIGTVALQQVVDKLEYSAKASMMSSAAGGGEPPDDTDIIFLRALMDGPILKSLVKAHDRLDEQQRPMPHPVRCDACELSDDLMAAMPSGGGAGDLTRGKYEMTELQRILKDPHVMALLESHDIIGDKDYDDKLADDLDTSSASGVDSNNPSLSGHHAHAPGEAIRMVGIRKSPNEPLGITVKLENNRDLVIARILAGGMIDRQGLLNVGDIVREVNGYEVKTPEQLQEHMKKAVGSITLKIIPSYHGHTNTNYVYMKAHFEYDPSKDSLIPSKEAGLSFKSGDILQVVNMDDQNWWQARVVGSSRYAGIIPSQALEERRKAYVRPEDDYSTSFMCGSLTAKRKRKILYHSNKNAEFDRHDLLIYEEVARMPPFQRKTLVLIGAQGVGRRTLKNRLIQYDPLRFATTIPHTCRPMREGEDDGKDYFYVTRQSMEHDIVSNRYLEHGEYGGNIYGTKLDSVRAVIRSGKMCVLDCNPQALKTLNTSEFMPYVVYVQSPPIETLREMHADTMQRDFEARTRTYDRALKQRTATMSTINSEISTFTEKDFTRTVEESARLKRNYERYFDLSITNSNMDQTFEQLVNAVNALSTEPQWVPVTWVY